ncbi:chalcone isomerase family protein [Aquabacterium sp.]|uniref:chalcone isomerase family protein n=1 Tax=Aquabacterium sp. TaxID=1872578 RepID=UPI0035B33EDE
MKALARTLLLTTALIGVPAFAAVELKGAKFEDTYQVASQTLQLNGAGVRVKFIVDVYAAGLYLPKKDGNAASAVAQSGPKGVKIVLLRDLTGEDFAEAMVKGFKNNNNDADVTRMQPKLDALRSLMLSFGSVKKGTSIHFDYAPATGTRILVDGKQRGSDIAGEDFYQAVLRIWLGNSPVDSDLKKDMLGK